MRPARSGFIFVSMALMIIVLLGVVGLAIDGGIMYNIKAKLSTAVDAAALGAARSLSRGTDLASQRANAEAAARRFFDANFPDGYWASVNRTFTVQVDETVYKTRTVSTRGAVDAPMLFLRILGYDSTRVAAQAVASRRDVNLIILLDRSGSIHSAGADETVRSAARSFVDKFADGRDRIGMVTFSGPYRVAYSPTLYFRTGSPDIISVINAITFDGNTGTAEALWQSYQLLANIGESGTLNIIVFFTDGRPTAVTAQFPVKTQVDTRYDYQNTGTLVSTPASSCSSSTAKVGFISAPMGSYPTTGTTWGVMVPLATSASHNEWTLAPNCTNCSFAPGSDQSYRPRMRRDIAYIPATDTHGTSTSGYKPLLAGGDKFTSGPYNGQIRPDSPRALRYVGDNLSDNVAYRIRNDSATLNLAIVTFAIGLGGTSTEPIDHELLRRISNDPQSSIFDNTKPPGLYVYSPTPAELNDAFNKVASEILRLAL
jgi:Flp pilus assembly protein TadG